MKSAALRLALLLALAAPLSPRAAKPAMAPTPPLAKMKMPGEIKAMALSGDGKSLAILHVHGYSIREPDGAARIDRGPKAGGPDAISIALSGDGGRVALGGPRGGAKVWESASGKLLKIVDEPNGETRGVALSADGGLLAVTGTDGRVCLFPFSGNKPAWPCAKLEDAGQTVAFSPDGALLAASGDGGRIHLYRTADGTDAGVIPGPDTVNMVAFSPDGKLLAAGGNEEFVRVWRVADRAPITAFPRGADWVFALAFATDSDRLAWITADGGVRAAAVSTGKSLLDLQTGCKGMGGIAVAGEALQVGCEEDGFLRYALPPAK